MSIHPSLKIDSASAQQRSVLTRIERIKDLMKKGLWFEDQKVTGLPKTKIVRIKTRKVKDKKEETPETQAAATPTANPSAAPAKSSGTAAK